MEFDDIPQALMKYLIVPLIISIISGIIIYLFWSLPVTGIAAIVLFLCVIYLLILHAKDVFFILFRSREI